METTGYEKLRVGVMLCVTADGNKLQSYICIKWKDSSKRKFLQGYNSLGPKKCMDGIGVNGRLAWMCM
jgi:hypothetical protein